jgi:broad specificity phosphatase PhoE
MTARLIIVRHGNTFDPGDVVRRVGGRTDLPLSASGARQVMVLAALMRGRFPLLASARSGPLRRTRQTAEAILSVRDAPPELGTELFLREIDHGPDENQPEADVVARIGREALDQWETRNIPPPGWKVDPDAIIANWQGLLDKVANVPGDHLVVTSNGIARFALAAAGLDAEGAKLATAALGLIAHSPHTGWTRAEWNTRADAN